MHMHNQNGGYNFPSNRETERNRGGLNWPPPAGVYYTSESEPGCKVRRSRHISISEDGSRANHGGGAGGSLASSYGSSSQQGRMPMQCFGRARPQQLQTWAPLSVRQCCRLFRWGTDGKLPTQSSCIASNVARHHGLVPDVLQT